MIDLILESQRGATSTGKEHSRDGKDAEGTALFWPDQAVDSMGAGDSICSRWVRIANVICTMALPDLCEFEDDVILPAGADFEDERGAHRLAARRTSSKIVVFSRIHVLTMNILSIIVLSKKFLKNECHRMLPVKGYLRRGFLDGQIKLNAGAPKLHYAVRLAE
jgi:hypothetical protein